MHLTRGIQVILASEEYGLATSGSTTIELQVGGSCVDPGDCDLFVAFGTAQQYVTVVVPLDGSTGVEGADSTGDLWIFPSSAASLADGNVSSLLMRDNGTDVFISADWHQLPGSHVEAKWPFRMIVTCDENTTAFAWTNGTSHTEYVYHDAFDAESDIHIAITNDIGQETGEEIDIHYIAIDVTRTGLCRLDPLDPSSNPTIQPSLDPTQQPSLGMPLSLIVSPLLIMSIP